MQSRGRYGGYVSFVQQVIRPSQVSSAGVLSLFFNATMADRRTATTDYQIAGGLTYTDPSHPAPRMTSDLPSAPPTSTVASPGRRTAELAGLGPVAVQ